MFLAVRYRHMPKTRSLKTKGNFGAAGGMSIALVTDAATRPHC
jgi:hypothetical protein